MVNYCVKNWVVICVAKTTVLCLMKDRVIIGNGNGREWECLMSTGENDGNWNKCLAGMGLGMGVGLKLMGMQPSEDI